MIEFDRRGYNSYLGVYESYYMARENIRRMKLKKEYLEYEIIKYKEKIYKAMYEYEIKKTRIENQEVYEIVIYRRFDVAAN